MTPSPPLAPVTGALVTHAAQLTDADLYAALDEHVRADVRAQAPANTTAAYASDWRAWLRFADLFNVDPCRASVGLVVAFIRYLRDEGNAVTTIERRVSGVKRHLRDECGLELSSTDNAVVRQELANVARTAEETRTNRGRGQADVLTVKNIRTISGTLPDDLAGHRDRAILLCGFGIGSRQSEVSALDVEDVEVAAHGLLIDVRASKGGKSRTVAVGYGTHELTCPVRAWTTWLRVSGITTGAAFVPIGRYGHPRRGQRISPEGVGDAINRRARAAGIPGRITGHSVRAGMATEARRAGHDHVTIARQGGWAENSRALYRYLRIVDQWADNALVGIGL